MTTIVKGRHFQVGRKFRKVPKELPLVALGKGHALTAAIRQRQPVWARRLAAVRQLFNFKPRNHAIGMDDIERVARKNGGLCATDGDGVAKAKGHNHRGGPAIAAT